MDSLVMPLDEAVHRDAVLRVFLEGRDWDLDGEQDLVRHLVRHSAELLPAWPYLIGYEWGLPNESRGDLLFFDGEDRLAAVEVKALAAQNRNKRRNQVEQQANEAAERARSRWPNAHVTALVYTDDEHKGNQPPRSPMDRIRYP